MNKEQREQLASDLMAEAEHRRGRVVDLLRNAAAALSITLPPPRLGEREAFEAWGETLFFSSCFEREDSGEYTSRGLQGAWLGWQARAAHFTLPAAFAQPIRSAFLDGYRQGIHDELVDEEAAWNRSRSIHIALDSEQHGTPPSAQVQGEQPEVVAWRYGFSGGIVSDKACLAEWKADGDYQPLMTVAQHERIVAALEADWRRNVLNMQDTRNEVMRENSELRAALSAPPAAGVSEDAREAVAVAVAEALGEALDCTRVWSAWGVGTMSEGDFRQVADDPERVAEIADAAIAAMGTAALTPSGGAQEAWKKAALVEWCSLDFTKMTRREMAVYIGQQNFNISHLQRIVDAKTTKQQPAIVLPERCTEHVGDRDNLQWARGANWMHERFLHLNPHLQLTTPSQGGDV